MNTSLSNSVCSSPLSWADSELWIVGASCWGEGGEERGGDILVSLGQHKSETRSIKNIVGVLQYIEGAKHSQDSVVS